MSRLESAHYDRKLGSLVAHLHAVGAELHMAFKAGEQWIQVTHPAGAQGGRSADDVGLGTDHAAVNAR